ncbi:hypothetical protein ACFE04_016238 [Oxalis oulophora]
MSLMKFNELFAILRFDFLFLITRYYFLISDKFEKNLEPVLEDRIEELRHRLRIELAVYEGAKNVIRSFQNAKSADKKTLQEVSHLCLKLLLFSTLDRVEPDFLLACAFLGSKSVRFVFREFPSKFVIFVKCRKYRTLFASLSTSWSTGFGSLSKNFCGGDSSALAWSLG